MPKGRGKNASRRSTRNTPSGLSKRERVIASANAPTLTTISLHSGAQRNSSCAVFNVVATVEGLSVSSPSVPMNICIPANPLRAITQAGQSGTQTINQQSDMSSIGALYDEFRVDGVSVHYQPSIQSTGSNVRMGIVSDYDSEPAAGLFATLKTLAEYENSLFMNSNSESELIFCPNKVKKATVPWYSTANTSIILGGIGLALWHNSSAVTVGSIVVKWRIVARGNVF